MKKTLTMKEHKRLKVMHEVMVREKTIEAASAEIGVFERQGYWILAKIRDLGAFGMAHRNRGRLSSLRIEDEVRDEVLRLRDKTCKGFNDRHFADELNYEEELVIGREGVRKILREAGVPTTRKTKKRKHHHRRAPMERFGETPNFGITFSSELCQGKGRCASLSRRKY